MALYKRQSWNIRKYTVQQTWFGLVLPQLNFEKTEKQFEYTFLHNELFALWFFWIVIGSVILLQGSENNDLFQLRKVYFKFAIIRLRILFS